MTQNSTGHDGVEDTPMAGKVACEGVMLTVTESGFDQIPLARRATAFTANEQGWSIMVKVIKEYLAGEK